MRALFVDLLITGPEQTRVVIGRHELSRLFEDRVDDFTWDAFFPRLQVCDLLEEAIEHLEIDMTMAAAEEANPDLTRGSTRKDSHTYWFATPGADSDVVFQTFQRAQGYNLTGLISGPWSYGPTYVIETDGQLPTSQTIGGPSWATPTMTAAEAITALRSHLSAASRKLP
jgi:hypothetical protein